MEYISTRNTKKIFSFKEVFLKGLAPDGGLFVPKNIPYYNLEELMNLKNFSYNDLASNNFNPRTRKNADRLVSLPIHPFMTPEDCLKVVKILNSWKSEKKAVEQLAHRAERV